MYGSTRRGRFEVTPGELFGRISGVIITTSSVWSFCAALLLNSKPRIGMSPMPGIFCIVDVDRVVHQTGDGERLPVVELELGLGAARRQRRNAEAVQHHGVGEVERADFGRDLEMHAVAVDDRQ